MSQKISLIIPTYNRSYKLKVLLDSICKQSIKKDYIDVIIIDDGSTDDTKALVKKYKELININYIFQKNKGMGYSRNRGIILSKSNLISFIADDYILPKNYCLKMINNFKNKKIKIIRSLIIPPNNINFYQKLSQFLYDFFITNKIFEKGPKSKKLMKINNYIPVSGAATFRKYLFYRYGFFSPLRWAEDAELGYRFYKKGIRVHIDPKIEVKHDHRNNLLGLLKQHFNYGMGMYLAKRLNKDFPLDVKINLNNFFLNLYIYTKGSIIISKETKNFKDFLFFMPIIILVNYATLFGSYYSFLKLNLL